MATIHLDFFWDINRLCSRDSVIFSYLARNRLKRGAAAIWWGESRAVFCRVLTGPFREIIGFRSMEGKDSERLSRRHCPSNICERTRSN